MTDKIFNYKTGKSKTHIRCNFPYLYSISQLFVIREILRICFILFLTYVQMTSNYEYFGCLLSLFVSIMCDLLVTKQIVSF